MHKFINTPQKSSLSKQNQSLLTDVNMNNIGGDETIW